MSFARSSSSPWSFKCKCPKLSLLTTSPFLMHSYSWWSHLVSWLSTPSIRGIRYLCLWLGPLPGTPGPHIHLSTQILCLDLNRHVQTSALHLLHTSQTTHHTSSPSQEMVASSFLDVHTVILNSSFPAILVIQSFRKLCRLQTQNTVLSRLWPLTVLFIHSLSVFY